MRMHGEAVPRWPRMPPERAGRRQTARTRIAVSCRRSGHAVRSVPLRQSVSEAAVV